MSLYSSLESPSLSSSPISSYILHLPLKSIFQRIPGLWLLSLFPFAVWGPIYAPYLFGFYYTILHLLFFLNNCRSAYGVYVAYNSAKIHSTTDWYQKFLDDTSSSHSSTAAATPSSDKSNSNSLKTDGDGIISYAHQHRPLHPAPLTHHHHHDLPFDHIVHVIILPNYKEDMGTLEDTLDVLASHSRALTQYKVYF